MAESIRMSVKREMERYWIGLIFFMVLKFR